MIMYERLVRGERNHQFAIVDVDLNAPLSMLLKGARSKLNLDPADRGCFSSAQANILAKRVTN